MIEPRGALLAVHAHPDDETLASGALLATWAAAGLPVTVVTCTRGERGEVIALPGTTSEGLGHLEGDGEALAAWRSGEIAAALAALSGPTPIEHVWLDGGAAPGERFEDSGMAWIAPGIAGPDPTATGGFGFVALDDAAARLATLIAERNPTVVATYEPGGGYGHPDHVRAAEVTRRALDMLGADAPALWEAVALDADVRAARRALTEVPEVQALIAAEGLTLPDPDEPVLPPFAQAARELGDLRVVEVAPVLERVLGAMRAHATQIRNATAAPSPHAALVGWYALSNDVLAPILPTETYRASRVGA